MSSPSMHRSEGDNSAKLLSQAPAMLWRSNCGTSRTYFNDRWLAFTGRSVTEEAGDGWLANVHPEDLVELGKTIELAEAERSGYQHEYRLRRHDGEYRWLLEHSEPAADGKSGFSGICIDVTERHELRTEPRAAVVEGWQRLEDLIQNLPGVLWETRGEFGTADYRVTFVSGQIEEMTGYSLEQAEAARREDIFALIHPEDRRNAYVAAAQAYEDGKPRSVRFRWMATDGRAVWIQSYFRPITAADGRVIGLRGVNLDVTEQQRAEDTLTFLIDSGRVLGSSLNYESTLQNVARLAVPQIADWCSVYLLNDKGDLEEVSIAHVDPERVEWVRRMHEAERLRPGSRETGPYRVVATGESTFIREVTPAMIDAAVEEEEERAIIHQLGLRSYMCVPMSRHGQVIGAIAFVAAESGYNFDEFDLRAAEHLGRRAGAAIENAALYQEAERERARFRSIVSSVDYAVCQIDSEGRVEHLNPSAESILGAASDRLRGQNLHELVHGQGPDGLACTDAECPIRRVLESGEPSRGNDRFITAVGSFVPVRVNCSPILVDQVLSGAVVAFEDISERLAVERRKDDFLAFATHELRNPLTPILGLSRWLDRRVSDDPGQYDEELREAAETLASEANRMANIVDVFLDLSRIESNRLVIDSGAFDLCAMVSDEVRGAELRHPHVRVALNVPLKSVAVISDETRVRQVLSNLLENAAKYAGEHPAITVTLSKHAQEAVIRVRDEGPGIPEADQPHIFERFYRSASGPARKGFGVGLFLTKEIVEQLGGHISFVSEPGKGAEFTVVLPLRAAVAEQVAI